MILDDPCVIVDSTARLLNSLSPGVSLKESTVYISKNKDLLTFFSLPLYLRSKRNYIIHNIIILLHQFQKHTPNEFSILFFHKIVKFFYADISLYKSNF